MRCKYCNVEVLGEATLCPLCHEKLEADGDASQIAPTYPPKRARKRTRHTHFTFNNVYLFVAAVLFLIGLTVNLMLTPRVQWFWLIGLVALYGFLLIRYTILSAHSIGMKILQQAAMILILVLASYQVFRHVRLDAYPKNLALEIALPSILSVSTLVMGILTAVHARRRPSVLIDCMLLSALGLLPLILYFARVLQTLYGGIVSACVSAITILCCLFFGRHELGEEFRKKFHL